MPASPLLRILYVEDLEEDAALVTITLRRAGYAVEEQRVTNAAEMQAALTAAEWDAVIADHTLPGFSAPAALALLQQMELDLPFIIVSGTMSEVEAVAALRAGAHDYVTKGNLSRLAPALARELRDAEDRRQRRRAEAALYEAEARFAQVWETTSDALALSDAAGLIFAANPAYYALYGYSPEQVLGQTFAIVFPEEQRAQAIEQYRRVFADPEPPGIFETAVLRGDGTERFVESRATFITTAGRRTALLSTIRDVTERVRAEAALRASEERLRSTMDAMREGIQIISFDWRYLYVNDAAVAQNRQSREAVLGRTMLEANPGFELTRIFAVLKRAMEQRQAERIEEVYVYPDGSSGWFDVSAQPVPDGIFVLSQDITERKQAEANVERQLQRLNALRDIDIAITASLDLNLTLRVLLDQVVAQLNVDAVAVLLLDPQTLLLTFAVGRGFHTHGLQQTRLRLGEGFAGQAALERRIVEVPDLAAAGAEFRRADLIQREGFVHYIAVPLVTGGNVVGVLECFHRARLAPDAEWRSFLDALARQTAIAIDNAMLFERLQRSNADLTLAYDATIEGWSRALDLRDKETEGHSLRVTALTLRLSETVHMNPEELVQVRRGALLHDIGKMGVPDRILLKPGLLTDDEWELMRQHPTFAYELLAPVAFLRAALDIPYCHHEKWDGTGYPRGLKGEAIPLAARLFAVVDVWDALCADRPYRPAWPKARVLEHIQSLSGSHFDPRAVEAFLKLIE